MEKAWQYAQVDQLLLERNLLRSIARATGMTRNTIPKREKKVQRLDPVLLRPRPKKAQRKRWEALALDEMWTFVGCKK